MITLILLHKMSCALSMFSSLCLSVFLLSLFHLLATVVTLDSFTLVQKFNKGHSHLENVSDFQCLIQEAQGWLIELVWGPDYWNYCSGLGAGHWAKMFFNMKVYQTHGQGKNLNILINQVFIYNVNKSKLCSYRNSRCPKW